MLRISVCLYSFDKACGKTALIKQFKERSFLPQYNMTPHVTVETKQWNQVTFYLYDTNYYIPIMTNTTSVIYVYDVTNVNSFEKLSEYLDKKVSPFVGVIVANKIDLIHRVSLEKGIKLAEKHGMQFFALSGKESSTEELDKPFEYIAQVCSQKYQQRISSLQ